jgi:hypothetical protein
MSAVQVSLYDWIDTYFEMIPENTILIPLCKPTSVLPVVRIWVKTPDITTTIRQNLNLCFFITAVLHVHVIP